MSETDWTLGNRAAWTSLLALCLRELGSKNDAAVLTLGRERAVAILRQACRDHGDNHWPDNLALSDVIEKHLMRHVQARVEELEGHAELYRELAARVDADEGSLVAEHQRLREALEDERTLREKLGDFIIILAKQLPPDWESNDRALKEKFAVIWSSVEAVQYQTSAALEEKP